MKKIMCVLTAVMFVLALMPFCEASTTTTVSATAAVIAELNLTVSIIRVNSNNTDSYTDDMWDTAPSTSMAFGTLTHLLADGSEAGLFFSRPYYYVAFLGGFTSGRKFKIQSTCAGLTGPTTITKGFGVTYLDGDPKKADGSPVNSDPMEGTLGTPGSAVATNKLLYDSGPTGASRVITAYFGIPPYQAGGADPFPGFEPIPVDTPGGSYSGNVIFTLTLY